MSRSRTVVARRQRAKRRRRLIVANVVLLAAICGVAVWNGFASPSELETGQASSASRPGQEQGQQEDGLEPAPGESSEGSAAGTSGGGSEGSAGTSVGGNGSERFNAGTVPDAMGSKPESERVSFAFVGDVLLGEYVGTLLNRHGFDYPYAQVSGILREADVAAANLETAVTSGGEKPELKTYEFRSDPDALPAFREAGFDLVNLANNHTMDFGPEGLRDTMKHLKESDIAYVGAGETADEAYAPVYIEKNGVRIAVLGFSRVIPDGSWKAGENKLGLADTYDYTRPVQAIEAAKAQADIVVVLVHWGDEKAEAPLADKQVDLGRRYIDAGADLVIGSHPHVLQGFEYYKNRWIAYSLGNFIFTKSKDPLTYDSGILQAECGKNGECRLQLMPIRADTPQPQPMDPEKGALLLARLSERSYGASIDETGIITAKP
jgi:poly-gamma-glutamate capsule biosynthesis protein CapA/YwtB (metallophosphatase superfamily)